MTVRGYRLSTAGFVAVDDPTVSRQLGSDAPWQIEQFFESDGRICGYVVSDACVTNIAVDGGVTGLSGVDEVLAALLVAELAMGLVEPSELSARTPSPGADVDLEAHGFVVDDQILSIDGVARAGAWVKREYGLRTVVCDLGDCVLGVIQRGGHVVALVRDPHLDVD